MERLLQHDRACVLAAALASAFADELTVILSSFEEGFGALEPGHPARKPIRQAQEAALRCADTTMLLLTVSARQGVRPVQSVLDRLLDAD